MFSRPALLAARSAGEAVTHPAVATNVSSQARSTSALRLTDMETIFIKCLKEVKWQRVPQPIVGASSDSQICDTIWLHFDEFMVRINQSGYSLATFGADGLDAAPRHVTVLLRLPKSTHGGAS
jgi:hypothetical protein